MRYDDSGTPLPRCALLEVFALAVQAITTDRASERDWVTLRALTEPTAIQAVAELLAARHRANSDVIEVGSSVEWWCGTVRLLVELSFGEITPIEEKSISGCSQAYFDLDRHALEVGSAVRYLKRYLARLRVDAATEKEARGAALIARCVRLVRGMLNE